MTLTDSDLKLLSAVGLTPNDIKVYYALIKIGRSRVGPLARRLGMNRMIAYRAVARLRDKGLVREITCLGQRAIRPPLEYFANPPAEALTAYVDKFSERLNTIKALLVPKLQSELEIVPPDDANDGGDDQELVYDQLNDKPTPFEILRENFASWSTQRMIDALNELVGEKRAKHCRAVHNGILQSHWKRTSIIQVLTAS